MGKSNLEAILRERRKAKSASTESLAEAIMGKETALSADELSALVASTGAVWTPPSLAVSADQVQRVADALMDLIHEQTLMIEALEKRIIVLEKADQRRKNRNHNKGNKPKANQAQPNQGNQGNNNTTP